METMKVKAWGAGQGDFVLINTEDFDAKKHEKFGESETDDGGTKDSADMTVAQMKEALAAKGIAIPDGVTKKADIKALLDTAPAE